MDTQHKSSFADTGLSPQIVSILNKKDITTPTPIQDQSIPEVLRNDDVLGIAKTGTGKTLAFVLPLLNMLLENKEKKTGLVLIIAPTRELAYQIQESCKWFEKELKIYSTVIVGGAPQHKQVRELQRKPQIVIATPGRLIDLLEQKKLHLRDTKHIVLDEADRMFDMGFTPQIKQILRYAPSPQERQMLLFSATMSKEVLSVITNFMKEPVHIEIASPGSTADKVKQEVIVLDNAHKKDALLELLEREKSGVLIFTRTKHTAKKLTHWLRKQNHRAEELHGNRSLAQRKRAVDAIQKKRSRILVATDIAARGIDIDHLELVINYDLPDNPEDYVHRIGRTGRAGRSGVAISFVCTDQAQELEDIQKLIKSQIEHTSLEKVPSATLDKIQRKPKKGRGRGSSGYKGKRRNKSNRRYNESNGNGRGRRRSSGNGGNSGNSRGGSQNKRRSGGGKGKRPNITI